jgi:hypothetical protein
MSRCSSDQFENNLLVGGFDYDLQVWVKDGNCEQVGINREVYGGLSWLEARVQAFGLEGHLERLQERQPE